MKTVCAIALLLLCRLAQADGPPRETFSDEKAAVCLEIEGDRFGVNLMAGGGAHEILGAGALPSGGPSLVLNFEDSFGNKVSGSFDKTTGQLSLAVKQKGKRSPSAVSGAYGSYSLASHECSSNAL